MFALGMFRWSNRVSVVIMAASASALLVFTSPALFFEVGDSTPTFLLGVARLGYSFPVGILLLRMLGNGARRRSALALFPIAVWAGCLLFTVPEAWRGTWESVFALVLFPILLATGVSLELPRVAAPPFAFLGDVSFAVYAIHDPVIPFIIKLTTILDLGPWPAMLLFLAVLLALSHIVSRWYDAPVRAAITRWKKRATA